MALKSNPRFDLGFGGFLIAGCTAVLWEARDIPEGTFEPLGSGPVPRAVAVLILVLSLLVMLRAWRSIGHAMPGVDEEVVPRWADAAVVAAFTIAYALALHMRIGRFDVLSTIYLFFTIGLLIRFRRRALPVVALVAALVGFGCQLVFTKIFIVDLPGAF